LDENWEQLEKVTINKCDNKDNNKDNNKDKSNNNAKVRTKLTSNMKKLQITDQPSL